MVKQKSVQRNHSYFINLCPWEIGTTVDVTLNQNEETSRVTAIGNFKIYV